MQKYILNYLSCIAHIAYSSMFKLFYGFLQDTILLYDTYDRKNRKKFEILKTDYLLVYHNTTPAFVEDTCFYLEDILKWFL